MQITFWNIKLKWIRYIDCTGIYCYISFFQLCSNAKSNEATDTINAVSVHIRLTDYVKHLTHFYNMTTISEEYLVTAMNYMDNQHRVSLGVL